MRISYSSLEAYKNCPLKYKFKHIDRVPEPKSKEAQFGTLIHSVLNYIYTPTLLVPTVEQAINYFAKGWKSEVYDDEFEERSAFTQGVQMIQQHYEQNDIVSANIVDLESRFAIEIGNDETGKHVVSGIIDRIDKTKDGYEIIDYKTARKMPSQEKVDNDIQLSIYLRAFLERYPKEKENLENITVSLYYVKHGVKLSAKRTKEDLDKLEARFLDVIKAIESAEFEPILSPLCDWCGYKKLCPLWKHQYKEERKIDSTEAEQIIDQYLELKKKMSAEKQELTKLQGEILRYMEEEGVERVFGEGGIIAKSLRTTYKYDEERLRDILEPVDKWEAVLKIDGVALRNILATLPSALKEEVAKTKEIDKKSVSLSVKKGSLDTEDDFEVTE
ncbi:MAG: PD-(D/E)XK nuclease family protein [Candidatus Moranbacteria bacterium]|nr:PD-(D/E)XK nuclease family protein [Candidatus Moranbacteria bacterium]